MKQKVLLLLSLMVMCITGAKAEREESHLGTDGKFYLGVTSLDAQGSEQGAVTMLIKDKGYVTFRLPSSKETLSAAGVKLTAQMQNVEGLGVTSLRQHTIKVMTGLGINDLDLSKYLGSAYSFQGANLHVTVNGLPTDYTFSKAEKSETDGGTYIYAKPKSEAETQAAWDEVCKHVTTSIQDHDDSYFLIAHGSYIKNGTEYLRFHDNYPGDLKLDTLNKIEKNVTEIQKAAYLDECKGDSIIMLMKAGSVLAVGQSIATLNSDCRIVLPKFMLEGALAKLRTAAESTDKKKQLILALLGDFSQLIDAINGKDVTIRVTFPAVSEDIPTKEEIVAVTTDMEGNPLDPNSDEVAHVQEVLNNAAVNSMTDEETGINEAVVQDAAVEALKAVATTEQAAKITDESNISKYLKIQLETAMVATTTIMPDLSDPSTWKTTMLAKAMAYDVKPYVTTYVDGVKVTTVYPNSAIKSPISFRLPIDEAFTGNYVEIFHQNVSTDPKTSLGLRQIFTSTDGSRYVELSASSFSIYSYVLTESVEPIGNVYAGNSSVQEGKNIDEFNKIRETTPNAIMFVDEKYAEAVQTGTTNIIVEYSVGKKGSYYECPNFVLADKGYTGAAKDFYTPCDFNVVAGSCTRTFAANANAVCEPFAFTATEAGGKILTFAYYESGATISQSTAYFNKQTEVNAGIPCFVKVATAGDVTFDLAGKTIVANPEPSGNMDGVFVRTGVPSMRLTKLYYPSNDNTELKELSSTSAVSPFRCALSLAYNGTFNDDNSGNAKALPSTLNIGIIGEDTETTGINEVATGASAKQNAEVYTVNGTRVSAANQHGLYIVNGKKVIK